MKALNFKTIWRNEGDEMNWEQKAERVCLQKGLTVLGFEGGYLFIQDKGGEIYPVSEEIVSLWIKTKYKS